MFFNVKVTGIKCDTDGCDYHNDDVIKYRKWINKPCPKCGANLLTVKDFIALYKAKFGAFILSVLITPIHLFLCLVSSEYRNTASSEFTIPLNMDGSGKIKL